LGRTLSGHLLLAATGAARLPRKAVALLDQRRAAQPANGLLLTANLDALFDRFLISFDHDGRMLISPQIEFACHEMLGIPVRGLSAEEQGFLAFHRAQAGLS